MAASGAADALPVADRLLAQLARQRDLLGRDDAEALAALEPLADEIVKSVDALARLLQPASSVASGHFAAGRRPAAGDRPPAVLPGDRLDAIRDALRANQTLLSRLASGNRRALSTLFGDKDPVYRM